MNDTAKPFTFDETAGTKRFAPATQRNRQAISDVLAAILPGTGLVLEIASGTGEHVIHFAARFPGLIWQPTDDDDAGIASIESWRADVDLPNILPALRLDASAAEWPVTEADAILCVNMIHIAPWTATEGLMAGAAQCLPEGGILYLYGPYRQAGVPTAPSNEAFDLSLKDRNLDWGLRAVDDVTALALAHGLKPDPPIDMPANNLSLFFRRTYDAN
jgi:SAM-dependent methyltransferase